MMDVLFYVGKKLSSVHAILEQQFEEAMWRQPSVIVLDDLDCLCSKDSDMDIDPLENVRLTSGKNEKTIFIL